MMNKNKFKKLAAIACSAVLSGALAFTLTACNNNDNDKNDGNDTNTTQDALLLNKSTATVKVGETVTINVTSSTTGTITWSSSDTSVATVSAAAGNSKLATVSGLKAGTATITAKDGDITATCTVTVEAAEVTETVTIDGAATQYIYGIDGTLTLSATASEGSAITWETSDATVATVAGGTVTGVKAGEAVITAKVSDDIKATVTVKVLAATDMEYATGVDGFSTGWRYFKGGVSDKTVSIHESYGDVGAKIKYTYNWVSGDEWWNVQLFYRNDGVGLIGKDHSVTLTVVAPQAGNITVNGAKQELVPGENKVTVEHYDGITLAVAFGVENESSFAGTDLEFLIKDLVFETNTTATLETPEFTYDANSKVITINDDKNGEIEDKAYRLGFYNAENQLVKMVKVENGKAVNLNRVDTGNYTVKLQAYGLTNKIVDSGWSTSTATIEWTNANVNLNDNSTVPAGSWVYYSQSGVGAFDGAYQEPDDTLHIDDFTADGVGDWWGFQLIYKPQAGKTITGATFTITSTKAGFITVAQEADANVFELTETEEGSGVFSAEVEVSGLNISGDGTFIIWLCKRGDAANRLLGDITISPVNFTYAGGTPVTPEE